MIIIKRLNKCKKTKYRKFMMECQERNCGTLLYEEVRGDREVL